MARAIDALRPVAKERNVTIVATKPSGQGFFDLDAVRLERVVAGLVGDAIHAAPSGSRITVQASWESAAFRLHVSDDRAQQGPGIGMAIANNIVASFGGSIESAGAEGGRGFQVTVTLPQLVPERAGDTAGPADPDADVTRVDGLRVLYIDDEPEIADAVGITLESLGATCRTCTTFDDATQLLAKETYDVVITDLSLGGGSTGYDIIELLRVMPQHRLVPAMVLSGYDGEDDLGATRDAGFVAHIVKPIDFGVLAREMQSAVRRARAQGSR